MSMLTGTTILKQLTPSNKVKPSGIPGGLTLKKPINFAKWCENKKNN
jgi:hypothetical protein